MPQTPADVVLPWGISVCTCLLHALLFLASIYAASHYGLHQDQSSDARVDANPRLMQQHGYTSSTDGTPGRRLTFHRNHPLVIQRRIVAVCIVCLLSICLDLLLYQHYHPSMRFMDVLVFMGILPSATIHDDGTHQDTLFLLFNATAVPLALTALLFLGPLVGEVLDQLFFPLPWSYLLWRPLFEREEHGSRIPWLKLRNWLVGPLAEELVFRGAMVPLMISSGVTNIKIILLVPLIFGLAHVHHAVEVIATTPTKTLHDRNVVIVNAVMTSAFQFLYTTVFGWYATFLLLRTGWIMAPGMAHIFCNIMGLPDTSFFERLGGESSWKAFCAKGALLACYLVGAVGFVWYHMSWTNPDLYGSILWQR